MAPLPQLFEEDIQVFESALQDLLVKTEAKAALVIDKGGFLLTRCGSDEQVDTTTLGALAAASYAATQGMASLVNETNFRSIYQQGETFSLLVQNIDEHSLLTVIFNASTSVGAVKYYAVTTGQKIAAQLKRARDRNPKAGLDLSALNVADTAPLFRQKKP